MIIQENEAIVALALGNCASEVRGESMDLTQHAACCCNWQPAAPQWVERGGHKPSMSALPLGCPKGGQHAVVTDTEL